MSRLLRFAAIALVSVSACSSSPTGTLLIVRAESGDSETPSSLLLEEIKSGTRKTIARTNWNGSFDLGALSRGDSGEFRAYGLGADGKATHAGKTLALAYDVFDSARIPLFVAPTKRFVTLPGSVDSQGLPSAILATPRVLLLPTTGKVLTAYDLLSLESVDLVDNPSADTVAPAGSKLLFITKDAAKVLDLSSGDSSTLASVPEVADVAGGAAYTADGSHVFVAGPTRATPSSTVWYWGGETTVAKSTLSKPRADSAATFTKGLGLVVLGGGVAQAEVVSLGASQAFALPAESANAKVACTTGGTNVLFVRETGEVSTFDASCRQTCAVVDFSPPVLPPKDASLACTKGRIFYSSFDASNALHVYELTNEKATELSIRSGRKRAKLLVLPTEMVALVGGADTIEVIAAPESLPPR